MDYGFHLNISNNEALYMMRWDVFLGSGIGSVYANCKEQQVTIEEEIDTDEIEKKLKELGTVHIVSIEVWKCVKWGLTSEHVFTDPNMICFRLSISMIFVLE